MWEITIWENTLGAYLISMHEGNTLCCAFDHYCTLCTCEQPIFNIAYKINDDTYIIPYFSLCVYIVLYKDMLFQIKNQNKLYKKIKYKKSENNVNLLKMEVTPICTAYSTVQYSLQHHDVQGNSDLLKLYFSLICFKI